MTFEEWWEANWGRFLPGENLTATQTKLLVAECWNAALEASLAKKIEIAATGDDFFFDGDAVIIRGENIEALKVCA